jgi:hypothetical protein
MLATPAYANTETANGGNGGLGGGIGTVVDDGISAKSNGTKMHSQSNNPAKTNDKANYEVSVYGTGTGSQFWNVTANSAGTASHTHNTLIGSNGNNGVRALDTTASDNRTRWGWLGLLGLIGLFGIRSRNPERNK